MVTDPARVAVFRRVVDVVTDQDRWPLVWHCSAGKDRAGWVGTVVLLALGVERDAIVAHYLESNATGASQSAALLESGWMTEEVLELARPFMEVAPGYVEAQLAAVDDHWGGAGAMLSAGFGFDDQRLDDLRSRLLD
jgi:protein-tyrosine phosphatase